MRSGAWWALLVAALLLVPATAHARQLTERVTEDLAGDVALTGNRVLTCDARILQCRSALGGLGQTDNDQQTLIYADADADPATFDSSAAELTLPAGAEVAWAGLYWGGRVLGGAGGADAPDFAALGRVLLRAPGDTAYRTLEAESNDMSSPALYQAFANVTAIVRAAGAGAYGVADVQVGTGRHAAQNGGWALVVLYEDQTQPSRNLTVLDGLEPTPRVPIVIEPPGLRTRGTGAVRATLGLVVQDGDFGQRDGGVTLGDAAVANELNPRDNVFNSSLTQGGANRTLPLADAEPLDGLDPEIAVTFGWDVDRFDTVGLLANNAESATITFESGADGYFPGVIALATEVRAPRLETTKTVDRASANLGERLDYTLTVRNTGDDPARLVQIEDGLPIGLTYVPGSLRVDGAPVTQTGGMFRVVANVANTLTPGQSATVTFGARIATGGVRPVLANRAVFRATAATTGTRGATDTPVAETVVNLPDLGLAKTHPGAIVAGGTGRFDLTVANTGAGPTANPITVRDVLPAPFSPAAPPAGTGWNCSASAGQVVSCTRPGPLAPGASLPPVGVPVALAPAATEAIVNSATVTTIADADPADDAAQDTVVPRVETDLGASLTLRDPAPADGFAPGATIVWRVDVTNAGPSVAHGATLTEELPAPLAFALPDDVPEDARCAAVTCPLGDIPPGGTVTRFVAAALPEGAAGFPSAALLTNRVSVSAAGEERDPADDAAESAIRTVTLPAEPPPTGPTGPTSPTGPVAPPGGTPAPPVIAPPVIAPPPAPAAAADLAVRIAKPRSRLKAGRRATVRVRVVNRGQGPATGVALDAAVRRAAGGRARRARCPGLARCVLGTLVPGAARTVPLRFVPRRPGRIVLRVRARAAAPDANPADDARRRTITIRRGVR